MTTETAALPSWCCGTPSDVCFFSPHGGVRHRNPDLADWRGTVTPTMDGRYLRFTPGGTDVRITWHREPGQPEADQCQPAWYSCDAVAPIKSDSSQS